MWSAITFTLVPVWDDLTWWIAADWRDDLETPAVRVSKSGRCPMGAAASPYEMLAVALRALDQDLAGERVPAREL